MRHQRHIIKRQILEVAVPQKQGAYQLQQQLSGIYSRRLVPIIDKYCTALSDPDVIHRIEILELDLGEVPLDAFEDVLSERFEAELRRALAEAIRQQQSASGAEPGVKATSQLELFGYFVQTGTLPWWADASEAGLLDAAVAWLVAHAPGPLKALVADLLTQQSYLKRIVQHLTDPNLVRLAGLFSGALHPFITQVQEDLAAVFQRTDGLKAAPPHRLRHELWEAILLGVCLPGKPLSDPSGFLQPVLLQIAVRRGIRYSALISDMAQAVQRLAKSGHRFKSELPDLLSMIRAGTSGVVLAAPEPDAEHPSIVAGEPALPSRPLPRETPEPDAPAKSPPKLESLEEPSSPVTPEPDDVAEALSGKAVEAETPVPLPPTAAPPSRPPPRETTEPDAVAESPPKLESLEEPFSPVTPEPDDAAEASPGRTADPETPAESLPDTVAEPGTLTEPSPGMSAEPEPPAPSDQRAAQAQRREPLSRKRPRIDYGFSDADEWYIGNAGLVILWPFLGRFFENLDLLHEKQFSDAAALHRAVGLLQYLADGQPEPPPEYLLPLGKVLCGMDMEEVFDFGPPLTEAEIEEGATLLQAVIAHASILGSMSVQGFRGTFLLRKGQLSIRNGAWLLRVERESYDVVLDRFPWSTNLVKLPWMKALMHVEW